METSKIFADFNNTDVLFRIRLNTDGSKEDIEKYSIILKVGMKVTLDDHDELKAEGIIEFSESEQIWVAKIDWDKIEHY